MSNRQRLVVGIDGGATISHGVAAEADGTVVAVSQAGSLNFFGANLAETRRNLDKLKASLPPATDVENFVVASAALFDEGTSDQKEMLCLGILPLERTRLISDCQSAFFGATLGQPGLLVISGTGSIAIAQNQSGQRALAGGWGHLLGDEGSAYWIAVESIKAAIAADAGLAEPAKLGEIICAFFKIKTLPDLVPMIYQPLFTKEKVAALTAHLSETAAGDEPVFRSICVRAAQELARQASAAARLCGLKREPLPVFLVGRVLQKNAIVREEFCRALQAELNFNLATPALSPPLGAAALALVDSGITLTDAIVSRMRCTHQQFATNETQAPAHDGSHFPAT